MSSCKHCSLTFTLSLLCSPTLSDLEGHFAGEKVNLIWVVEYKYYYPARSQISITYYQPRERFKKLTIEIFFIATTLFI